jgi:ABC-type glycerol-3-phosphate transport system substrate-binding protein
VYKRYYFLLICMLITSILLCACQKEEVPVQKSTEIPTEELNIFILGDAFTVFYASENKKEVIYTTYMNLGEYESTICYGEEGFLFYDAFNQYQQQNGIRLNLHWYQYPDELEKALLTMDKEELPDIIITNYSTTGDFYQYMKQGFFYDITSYTEAEELYTSDEYYNLVLEAGRLNGKQYILPILFNIDTLMGCEKNWNILELNEKTAESHEQLMNVVLQAQRERQLQEVIGQWIAYTAYYTPYALYDAAGERWIDYEKENVSLNKQRFYQMAEFYRNFLQEQFGEVQIGQDLLWEKTKHMEARKATEKYMEEYIDNKGCIIEGGGAFQGFIHNAAAQAWYYESRYQDMGEEFRLMAIPGAAQGTTAHVSCFGGVLSTSKHPEEAYNFLRYLMDTEIFCGFGISVNKENVSKMLANLSKLEYELRYGCQPLKEDGTPYTGDGDYIIHPMTKETKESLEKMLENITSVSLPDWPVYEILRKQLEKYGKGEISVEIAYETAYHQLENYLKERK